MLQERRRRRQKLQSNCGDQSELADQSLPTVDRQATRTRQYQQKLQYSLSQT